jgi:hypothetical protein
VQSHFFYAECRSVARASVDSEIQAAKIGRDRRARLYPQVTQAENCCAKLTAAKVPKLLLAVLAVTSP